MLLLPCSIGQIITKDNPDSREGKFYLRMGAPKSYFRGVCNMGDINAVIFGKHNQQ